VFERLSDRARNALALAEDEARLLRHGHVGTEHLLLGVLADADSPAARALVAHGATLDGSRSMVAEAVGEQDLGAGADPQLTPRANRALERAQRLSLRRHDAQVDTDHIMLSVLDIEGRAGQVLRGLGVDLVSLHGALAALREEPGASPSTELPTAHAMPGQARPSEPAPDDAALNDAALNEATLNGASPPRCARCDSPLEKSLTYQVLTVSGSVPNPRDFVVVYCSICGTSLSATPVGQPRQAR
jgi:ATP-dependent Clp protease ATP-binding subunit ClpA